MRSRELALPLDPSADLPLYRQLAAAIAAQVREGRLVPGDALPGTRELAEQCGVTRNTVLAAFRELLADGWVESRQGSGTYVAQPPSLDPAGAAPAGAREPAFDLPTQGQTGSQGDAPALDLREDWPDARLLPAEILGRTYRMAMDYRAAEILGPTGPASLAAFSRTLVQWLGERWGVWREPANVLATQGESGAVEIALRGLLRPGARVLALQPLPAALARRVAGWGLEVAVMPWTGAGPDLATLETAAGGLLLVPAGRAADRGNWSEPQRIAFLELARRRRLPVLELEGARELFEGKRPALPLAAQDPHGICLLTGGFERTLAPGLRLGYLLGPTAPMRALARLGRKLGLLGDPLLTTVFTRIMEDGELGRFFRKVRPLYARRRQGAGQKLEAALGIGFPIEVPGHGLGLWLHLPPGLDATGWIKACADQGLRLPDPDGNCLYLGCGALGPEGFSAAAAIMAAALPRSR